MSEGDVPGLAAAAAALAGANVVAFPDTPAPEAPRPSSEGKPKGRRGGGKPREPGAPSGKGGTWQLPPGCPVTALGTQDGVFFYLDAVGQLRALKARDHGNKDLLALFAPRTDFLHQYWPRMNAKGDTTGWRPEEAGEVLMSSCAAAGVWNALDKVRGRGAWLDAGGGLILHCGDAVMIGGQWQETGLHDGHVYPAAPRVARPLEGRAGTRKMDELLETLRSWNWARPGVDPYLMLGWLACAMLGGALEWRPLAWVTGDKGTGKSTLQRLIDGVMGGALLWTSDASEAGIRQTLGNQTLPVAIDEAEADEDNRKLLALIKLARQASSGGKIVRGGADHNAQSFVARSCFLLSSILIPPLQGQDRSRLAVMDLKKLPAGTAEPKLSPDWLRDVGAVMRRRLLDGWPRFPETLRVYRELLKEGGHTARSADQFGTLLAGMDLLLSDVVPKLDDVAEWQHMLSADALAETREDVPDADRCLAHLLTSSVNLEGGSRPQTVAHWIARAASEMEEEPGLDGERPKGGEQGLAVVGLRVMKRRSDASRWVAVAVAHQGLARLFQNTHWQARSGAAGVWGQSLARLPGVLTGQNVRVGGMQAKTLLVPLALCRDEGEERDL
jgi:hypothetical protein